MVIGIEGNVHVGKTTYIKNNFKQKGQIYNLSKMFLIKYNLVLSRFLF